MSQAPWHSDAPPFSAGDIGTSARSADDELCDRVRADARRLAAAGHAPGLERYLSAIPDLASRPAALDTAIVVTLELATASGIARDEALEAMLREHPDLRAPILAADFLDQTLGPGALSVTAETEASLELPAEIGPPMPRGRKRYELRTRIAEGATGVVYRAIDRAVSTPDGVSVVAVKCLRDVGFRLPNLFKLEAQRARRVEHASVARVLDAGEDERAGEYLVFEYCEGATLEQWVTRRGRRPDVPEAVDLALAIAGGLGAVHLAGFCHGDLHPGNIMILRDGTPRLIDFGASRSDAARLGSGPRPMGALGFAAPELFRAVGGLSGRSADLYALAGLLFWLLTGEPPNGATVEEAEATIGGERTLNFELLSGCGRDLREVLQRALARDPVSRFPSVEAFAEDLRRTRRHEPLAWSPGPWTHRARLSVRRAPAAHALAAGVVLAGAIAAGSLCTAMYVSNRASIAEARTEVEASRSEAHAETARRKLAESEALRMDMARAVASSLNTALQGVRLNSESIRWLAPLVILERFASDEFLAEPILAAETKKKRVDICATEIAPCLERARIDHLHDLLIAGALSVWRIEDGEYEDARPLLAIARSAARRMLTPADPAAVRLDVYWAMATVLASRASRPTTTGGEVTEATEILRARGAILAQLGPRMRDRVNEIGPLAVVPDR